MTGFSVVSLSCFKSAFELEHGYLMNDKSCSPGSCSLNRSPLLNFRLSVTATRGSWTGRRLKSWLPRWLWYNLRLTCLELSVTGLLIDLKHRLGVKLLMLKFWESKTRVIRKSTGVYLGKLPQQATLGLVGPHGAGRLTKERPGPPGPVGLLAQVVQPVGQVGPAIKPTMRTGHLFLLTFCFGSSFRLEAKLHKW